MAKQTFTAGQVLTAAQMNNLQTDIFNQTTSTKTGNYSFVVGDRGTRVIGNGTSITFTVDNNIFTAGDTIKIHNINSTVLTIAAGSGVTINAAAGLTIAQYQEATLFATSASSFLLFESTASSAQGLTLLNTTSFSGVSSQSINDVFSATYNNYRIVCHLTNTSAADGLTLRLRVSGADNTTSNYNAARVESNAGGTVNRYQAGVTSFDINATDDGGVAQGFILDFQAPFATNRTVGQIIVMGQASDAGYSMRAGGFVFSATTSFTGYTLLPGSGTITGSLSTYAYNA